MIKRGRKITILFLVILWVTGGIGTEGWSQEKPQGENPPINDGKAFIDLVIARPIGLAVGLLGVGIFITTLPFTIPTRSADEAAKSLILDPFKFSFGRKFPDEDLK